jgi:hypothetical protein
MIRTEHYDVAVIGGGTAGVVAAIAAAKNGAKTILVESAPMVGGELTSIIPIDGCKSVQGKWVLGGIGREFFEKCREYGGYIGDLFDWRMMWAICLDPEILKLVIIKELAKHNVRILLNTFATEVIVDDRKVVGVYLNGKGGKRLLSAEMFVDCTGDGDIAVEAGAGYEVGDNKGGYQPVSLMYKMANVNFQELLEFVKNNPDEFHLGEHPNITKDAAGCAQELAKQGLPCVGFKGNSKFIHDAVGRGEMHPCSALFIFPTSVQRKEVCINTNRVINKDATDASQLGEALPELVNQTLQGSNFLISAVPGFKDAVLSNVSSRIGIRETRRIIGEYVLTVDDVTGARKFDDVIAKGAHHVDIHTPVNSKQVRVPIKEGNSYDIPFRCLIPVVTDNLLVAGRCISSTREANASSRVMATCMSIGQAAGTAAAICVKEKISDLRKLKVEQLQEKLRLQGAVID